MKRPLSNTRLLVGLNLALLLTLALAGCSLHRTDETIPRVTLATVFPETGADAATGLAMEHAVDLAVQQYATSIKGYRLTVKHIDSAKLAPTAAYAAAIADSHVLGVVGPFESAAALGLLPAVRQAGVTTISPGAVLPRTAMASAPTTPSPTNTSTQQSTVLSNAFFDLAVSSARLGSSAADLAVASARDHGLGAHAVYVVDDGTDTSKALVTTFADELKTKGGTVAGTDSLHAADPVSPQHVVSGIIAAAPDLVFFAGSDADAATLRRTLTQTGAPSLQMLTVGAFSAADKWTKLVGSPLVAGNTVSLTSAINLSSAGAKAFALAYSSAFQRQAVTPQTALAYDAAMDEIAAMRATVAAKQPLTRAQVRTRVAETTYNGITGPIAFGPDGGLTRTIPLTLYTWNAEGNLRAQTALP